MLNLEIQERREQLPAMRLQSNRQFSKAAIPFSADGSINLNLAEDTTQ